MLTSLDLEAAYSLSFWRCVSVAQSRSSLVLTAESLSHSLAEVSFWRGKGEESAAPDLPDASEEDADYVDGASSSAGSDASQEEGEDVADGGQAATKSEGGVDAPAEERRDGNAALAQAAPHGARLAHQKAAAHSKTPWVRPWCRGTLPLALSCPAQYRNVASTSSAHAPSGSLATRWTFRRARASSRTRRALASSGQTMSTWHSARPCGGCGKSTRCISRGAFSLSTCRRR